MIFNYEKKYAFAEVDSILDWLGEEYKNKIPKKLLQNIKAGKKFGYRPEIDFEKPIENQIRQETKNIIAYLNYNYWLVDEESKKMLKKKIQENEKVEKERKRLERLKEIEIKAKLSREGTVTDSINKRLKENEGE